MKKQIQELLERMLEEMGLEETVSPQVSVPENPEHGDYSTNVAMLLSKQLKKPPVKIAEEVKDAIQKYQNTSGAGIIDRVEVAGPGFINLYLSEASLSTKLAEVLKKGKAYGHVTKLPLAAVGTAAIKPKKVTKITEKTSEKSGGLSVSELGPKTEEKVVRISRKNAANESSARQDKQSRAEVDGNIISAKRIMIEFADPNPFKEIHIGHVRNISLGESFCRLMESQGNIVRRANYEGDVGLHVAKALYGKMHGASWEKAYAAGSKSFEEDEGAKREIIEINNKIYAGDPSFATMYKEGRQWSLDRFEAVYGRLGTRFDRYYFESEVAPLGIKIIKEHQNVFEPSEGAIVYRGEKVGLHTRVFETKEHYATYEAKDLALAPLKYSEWPHDLSIIMTGNEQSEYFKVMLAALSEINPELAAKTRHMPFGMVRLTSGKMSSRTGDVVTADWLIEEAKKKIRGILSKNASNYSERDKSNIAEKAAVAAIKYSMLRVNASSDIAFDLEASVSFEGDSGPYLQYTYARCRSVIRKSSSVSDLGNVSHLIESEERNLARNLIQFPDVVSESAENFAPNTICTYLFHLAQQFNLFYAKHEILGNSTRHTLTAATAQVLQNGLYLLGIDVLEKM